MDHTSPIVSLEQRRGAMMLRDYRNHLRAAGRAEGTVTQRLLHLDHLSRRVPLLAASEQDLVDYLASKRDTHSAEARKSMRTSMRTFYKWATRKGLIEENPALELAAITVPRTVARIAPDDDLQAALITAPIHVQAMIMLARFGCLRLAELTTLHTRHRTGNLLRITGKGSKTRIVPANADLMRVLLELEREQGDGYYFPGRYGAHMHVTAVGKIITRATGWNPHSLRHAGATAAYLATGDLRGVQEFLGHASLATTERYLHTTLEQVCRVADATSFKQVYRSPHSVAA